MLENLEEQKRADKETIGVFVAQSEEQEKKLREELEDKQDTKIVLIKCC